MIPTISGIDFLQESMSQHGSRGAILECEARVEEIQDNMKSILGKVKIKTKKFDILGGPWMIE